MEGVFSYRIELEDYANLRIVEDTVQDFLFSEKYSTKLIHVQGNAWGYQTPKPLEPVIDELKKIGGVKDIVPVSNLE